MAAGRSVLHQSVSHGSRPEGRSSIAPVEHVLRLGSSGTVSACELGKAGLWSGGALGLLLWNAIDPYEGGSIGTISDFEIGGVLIGFTNFTNIARPSPFRVVATHSDVESNGNSVTFMQGEHDVLGLHNMVCVLVMYDIVKVDGLGIHPAVCVAVSLPYAIASHVLQSQMWDASPGVVSTATTCLDGGTLRSEERGFGSGLPRVRRYWRCLLYR